MSESVSQSGSYAQYLGRHIRMVGLVAWSEMENYETGGVSVLPSFKFLHLSLVHISLVPGLWAQEQYHRLVGTRHNRLGMHTSCNLRVVGKTKLFKHHASGHGIGG